MIALIEMEKSELPFTIWPSTLVDYAQGSTLLTLFSFVQQLFVSDHCWWALYGPLVIGSMKQIGIPPWSPSHNCCITRGQLHHNVISPFAMVQRIRSPCWWGRYPDFQDRKKFGLLLKWGGGCVCVCVWGGGRAVVVVPFAEPLPRKKTLLLCVVFLGKYCREKY